MKILESIPALRAYRTSVTGTVGLVPTMGYLHEGHISLVKYAVAENDRVIATIFVNPTQFGENEDLEKYPRDLPRDFQLLEESGVDAVFVPTPQMIYPQGYQTYITVQQMTQRLEGVHRPGHFRGVATVVAKLFNLTQPDRAYFGQKDAQQVVVIRRMVADLNMPIEIVVCPIMREADGLAMSSRNVYLKPDERVAATVINLALQSAGDAYDNGERSPEILRQIMQEIVAKEPLAQVDYISAADAVTLEELTETSGEPILLSLTVKIGSPRLLDNCLLPLNLNDRNGATDILGNVANMTTSEA